MAFLTFIGAMLLGYIMMGYSIYLGVKKMRDNAKRERLYSLPVSTATGFLSIGNVERKTKLINSYSVDDKGNSYTHIGGGGSYSVLQSYTLLFRQEATGEHMTLYSIPGEKSLPYIPGGCVEIRYVTDSKDGLRYYIDSRKKNQ